MREFFISLGLIILVCFTFSFTYGLFWMDQRSEQSGLPAIHESPTGTDEELSKLLAEADAKAGGAGGAKAEIILARATIEMGQELYNQTGANSCLYCHGVKGSGGNVSTAAKLNNPQSWKITKILGSSSIDSPQFKEATIHVIAKGAIVHNSTFKDKASWFDIKKAGAPYDAQMVGLTGAPSASWIRQNKEKGITPEVAAEALYLYIRTF